MGTADAGHTWPVEGTAPPLARPGTPYVQLAFATSRLGWADFGYGLSFTANGGRTWPRVDLGAELVADLAYTGGKALAVTWEDWHVWEAGRDDHWHSLPPPPAQRGSPRGPAGAIAVGNLVIVDQPGLLAAPAQHAGRNDRRRRALGRRAQPLRPAGVARRRAWPSPLVASSGSFAAGSAGPASTTHGLYVSDDAAGTGRRRAIDDLARPGVDYFPAQDSPEAFAIPTADRFYVATDNFFSESADGGRSGARLPTRSTGLGTWSWDRRPPSTSCPHETGGRSGTASSGPLPGLCGQRREARLAGFLGPDGGPDDQQRFEAGPGAQDAPSERHHPGGRSGGMGLVPGPGGAQ